MSQRVRFYLISSEGRFRIPLRVYEKSTPVPQYAGTRQKEVQVTYEWRGDHLFLAARGFYADFDERGVFFVPDKATQQASQLVHFSTQIEQARREDPTVANADHYRRIKEIRAENQWQPSQEDLEAITADLMGRSRSPNSKAIPILTTVGAKRTNGEASVTNPTEDRRQSLSPGVKKALARRLASDEPLRAIHPTMLLWAQAFLLVCLDEGKNVSFYAAQAGVPQAVMSRHLLDLGDNTRDGPGLGPGLVTSRQDPHNPTKHQFILTSKGQLVADAIARALD
jgi:hypothetical protein